MLEGNSGIMIDEVLEFVGGTEIVNSLIIIGVLFLAIVIFGAIVDAIGGVRK